jgi:hypothetical protein
VEKELAEFKIEVLTQLAVINNKLDGYPETKKIAVEADTRSKQNEQEIKEITENNKWAFRTSVGAIITSAITLVFLFIKKGMGGI